MDTLCRLLIGAAVVIVSGRPGVVLASTQAPDTVQSERVATGVDTAAAGTDLGWGAMTPEQRAQAVAYSDGKHLLYFVRTFYGIGIMAALLFSGLSGRLRRRIERWSSRRLIVFAGYVVAFWLMVLLLGLPLAYYSGYLLEHQYGHSTLRFGSWLGELVLREALGCALAILLLGLLYAVVRRSPRRWWLWVGAGSAPVAVLLIVAAPVVVDPLFNRFTPLPDSALRTGILSLAGQAGIPDSRVFEVDASRQSRKYNAYVTGLFGTKRIVLYDTLIEDLDEEEILFVTAHEIGHYVMHHMWIGVAAVILFVFVAGFLTDRIAARLIPRWGHRWRFSSLADVASLPLFALVASLLTFFSQPFYAGLSRHFEHTADAYGLALTRDREAAARAFEKLAARNLSNPDPSALIEFWLYDHPTIKDRVAYVLADQGSQRP